jgi:PHP family Zn ribbon phosphoesterase
MSDNAKPASGCTVEVPVRRTKDYDRKCMDCGKAIYQGVLCAECHSKMSNMKAEAPK